MALTRIEMTADEWNLIGENVRSGWFNLQDVNTGDTAYYTYVPTGDDPPPVPPHGTGSLAIPYVGQSVPVNYLTPIDIYVYTEKTQIDVIADLL